MKITAGKKEKKSPGIRRQVVLSFGGFILIILALLWVFQIALLGPFYRLIKINEVKGVAQTLENNLESETLEETASRLVNATNTAIVVSDELGRLYVAKKASEKYVRLEGLTPYDLRNIFDGVNLQGGTKMETYRSQVETWFGGTEEGILYARTVRTKSGLNRLILLESELTPVDSTLETLRVQLSCLTVVMVLLGGVLAFFLSRRIARPIAAVNESAKSLAKGQYEIRFEGSGCREVAELADTLNYAAEELSKVEGLRRELLANVSHDLRTPLTMIKGYSEVMRDLPGENTPENVQIIIDETERLTNLVNDLLDLSRLEAGVVPLDRTRFNLTESIRAILTRYDKLAGYHFPFQAGEAVWVCADELRISQVVYNLVNNAVTYAGADKTVSLCQTVENGKVRISVTDTGEGIPADKLKDIWERYYKVDKEYKRAQVGTGLGLSIVKNILDLHGGSYGVESELGKGSTFWFELKLAEETTTLPDPQEAAH